MMPSEAPGVVCAHEAAWDEPVAMFHEDRGLSARLVLQGGLWVPQAWHVPLRTWWDRASQTPPGVAGRKDER